MIYECLSGCFSTFYLVVSRKKRNFAAKLDVEFNEWRMKQVEEWEYEASKMAYRDIKNSIDTAKREGKIEANTETAQRLLAMGLSAEQVAKATLLPLKIIENLRNS